MGRQYYSSEASGGTVAGYHDDGGEDEGDDNDDDASHLPPSHRGMPHIQYYPFPSIYRTWWKQENPTQGLIPLNLHPLDYLTSPDGREKAREEERTDLQAQSPSSTKDKLFTGFDWKQGMRRGRGRIRSPESRRNSH